ncbi:nodulation protein NodH [Fuscovulum ytuae]|uniref:Nodulation protein NodH n=1 Tax=Fuscovulum ytuae TaxID=3042299 RepID=A0ABY8Q380_9RHOB|nr:nodulation protein NodH [Fuscovulum sp. YMD61]WGV15093.1 nodulation protein NodH [Fuscovulum sp. YMD61]
MFAEMRTGSNFLEANLNAISGIACHGEAFNPYFIGKKDQTEMFGVTLAEREADPALLLRRMRERTPGLSGFRYFHDHDPRIFDLVMDDPRCAKIILTRNPLESYVSLKIAQATGQWKLTNPKNLKQAKARFDAVEFTTHLDQVQQAQIRLLNALQTRGQTAFWIDYDDIPDLAVLNGLAAFLGVEGRLESVDTSLTVQNPEPLADKVTNPAAMELSLARLDRFNLARTPNFEPRRAAAVPGYIASQTAPLLFMPIKGAPLKPVLNWFASLGGTETDFTHKTLRLWRRAHPGSRSFTVLRHPLNRAHRAFCALEKGPLQGDQRRQLARLYGITLPAPGQPFTDPAERRTAFLAFLRFLKRNLAGQTSFKTDPAWATQSAVLQGFATLQSPDLILREDRLAEGMAYLAAELGLPAPPPLPPQDPEDALLDTIRDGELEEAARDAYTRDYQGLGFYPLR